MRDMVHFREGWNTEFICGVPLFPKGKNYDTKFSRTYHSNPKKVTCKRCKKILKKR